MTTESQLLMLDVWLDPKAGWPDALVEKIARVITEEFQVLKTVRHDFQPVGTTWLAVLSASHAALHTYPEALYFRLDIDACTPGLDLAPLVGRVCGGFQVRHHQAQVVSRGSIIKP